ncbi:MAG: DNA primase [Chloroflexi bacterium]|nr:DNA primase [Chloroflexota bacterium]
MGVVDEIKNRIDIVDFISGYVPLKKAGRTYKGLCPFHSEKTPSFIVFPDSQSWHCFGACGTGGDIFTFLMKRENLDFGEALRILAARAGVQLEPVTPAKAAEQEQEERLFAVNAAAAEYFHDLLVSSAQAEHARAYLEKRGVTPDSWRAFQLGYSLNDWHALQNHLRGRGFRHEDIAAVGLIIQREGGEGFYDRFRGRLMFPIRDMRGRVIGFGGRSLDGSEPKYMNSPQSPIFDKGSVLYGIDLARGPIRQQNQAIIVEGYMDVIMAHQYGIANVVASMGTALTETQLRTLSRLTKRFALALDSDAAGSAATLRGLDTARATLDRDVKPVPVGPGLIRFESTLNVDLRIVTLPPGKDPDEIIRESIDAWATLLAQATPLVDYYFQIVTAELDLTTAKGKSEAVQRLKPVLQDVGDPIQRQHYIQRLARLVHVDERTLAEVLGRPARAVKARPQPEGEVPVPGRTERATYEDYVLYLISRSPDAVPWVSQALAEAGLQPPRPDEFRDPRSRAILEHIWEPLAAQSTPWPEIRAGLPQIMQDYLTELAQQMASLPPLPDEQVRAEVLQTILRLRQQYLKTVLADLRFLCQDAEEQHDEEALAQYTLAIGQHTQELAVVQKALGPKGDQRVPLFLRG